MKRLCIAVGVALALVGCHANRYDYVDISAAESAFAALGEGFRAQPDSLARIAWMLGQGRRVADILVYCGADSTRCTPDSLGRVPYGYAADTIGAEDLLHHVDVAYRRILSDRGGTYRALYLSEEVRTLSMPELLKLTDMARRGALIGGTRPQEPSDPADRKEFDLVVEEIWNNGNVLSGKTMESLLRASGVLQDVKTRTDRLVFDHRHLQDADIYRVTNPTGRHLRSKLKFRVTGRRPYVFYPGTGEVRPVTYKVKPHKTKVVLYLDPEADVFVVFGPYAEHHRLHVSR